MTDKKQSKENTVHFTLGDQLKKKGQKLTKEGLEKIAGGGPVRHEERQRAFLLEMRGQGFAPAHESHLPPKPAAASRPGVPESSHFGGKAPRPLEHNLARAQVEGKSAFGEVERHPQNRFDALHAERNELGGDRLAELTSQRDQAYAAHYNYDLNTLKGQAKNFFKGFLNFTLRGGWRWKRKPKTIQTIETRRNRHIETTKLREKRKTDIVRSNNEFKEALVEALLNRAVDGTLTRNDLHQAYHSENVQAGTGTKHGDKARRIKSKLGARTVDQIEALENEAIAEANRRQSTEVKGLTPVEAPKDKRARKEADIKARQAAFAADVKAGRVGVEKPATENESEDDRFKAPF